MDSPTNSSSCCQQTVLSHTPPRPATSTQHTHTTEKPYQKVTKEWQMILCLAERHHVILWMHWTNEWLNKWKLFTFWASQSRKQNVSDSSFSVRPSCLSSLRFSMNCTFKTSQYHFCTSSMQTKPKALLLKIGLITTHNIKAMLESQDCIKYSEGMKNEITRHTGMIKWI